MLQSKEYYLVVGAELLSPRRLTKDPRTAERLAADLSEIESAQSPNTPRYEAVSHMLTEQNPGPELDADAIARVAPSDAGIELIEMTDTETGTTAYLLPQNGDLVCLETLTGRPSNPERAAMFYEELSMLFDSRRMAGPPADVVKITIDSHAIDNSELAETSRTLLTKLLSPYDFIPAAEISRLTALAWTE